MDYTGHDGSVYQMHRIAQILNFGQDMTEVHVNCTGQYINPVKLTSKRCDY